MEHPARVNTIRWAMALVGLLMAVVLPALSQPMAAAFRSSRHSRSVRTGSLSGSIPTRWRSGWCI
jgi:hypothetical protein